MSLRNNCSANRSFYMALANSTTTSAVQRATEHARQSQQPRLPLVPLILGALSLLGMMLSLWMIFLYAQEDHLQGPVQRIFYFHVPMAWVGMLSFVVLTVASIGGLIRRD